MPTILLLRPSEVVKILEKYGWRVVRRRGSHIILTKPGHRATLSVPNHASVARGTLRILIARAGLSVDDFLGRMVPVWRDPVDNRRTVLLR